MSNAIVDTKSFNRLIAQITQMQPVFSGNDTRMTIAGFELPSELYGMLDKSVVISSEIQWAMAQQSTLTSGMGDMIGALPQGIIAQLQSFCDMTQSSFSYMGEVGFESISTLLDLLLVSELIAKTSAQMLSFMAEGGGGGDNALGTLFGGIGAASGTAGLLGISAAAAAGGGPPGMALALLLLAGGLAVGVGVNNYKGQKRRKETAQTVTEPIDKLMYSDERRRNGQHDLLFKNRTAWQEQMARYDQPVQKQANWREQIERSQATPSADPTSAAETIIGLLQKLVEKPVSRTVNSDIHISSLTTTATKQEFEKMLTDLLQEGIPLTP